MTKAQRKIETIHQRLMDVRDATPWRRGRTTQESEYIRAYIHAYETSKLAGFYTAAERFRHFLQDAAKRPAVEVPKP